VAEHIGLGRYGDPIDPDGMSKACRELIRVLAPGGDLYFGLPVGRTRVCFNAHRVFAANTIMDMFHELDFVDFSVVSDQGNYLQQVSPGDYNHQDFCNGLFHFRKPVVDV